MGPKSEVTGTRPKTGGRRTGVANKATRDARAAIGAFVDANAGRLTEWLDQVADGVLEPGDNPQKYVVAPNPAKAFELFQSVVEYHVPKLARTEHVGDDGGPITIAQVTFVRPPKREEE